MKRQHRHGQQRVQYAPQHPQHRTGIFPLQLPAGELPQQEQSLPQPLAFLLHGGLLLSQVWCACCFRLRRVWYRACSPSRRRGWALYSTALAWGQALSRQGRHSPAWASSRAGPWLRHSSRSVRGAAKGVGFPSAASSEKGRLPKSRLLGPGGGEKGPQQLLYRLPAPGKPCRQALFPAEGG